MELQHVSASVVDMPDEAPLARVREHLHSMKRRSTEAGVPLVEQVARAAEALIEVHPGSENTEREIMETVVRSLDLMALLVNDAGRRQQGYPPAALHEAVHVLLEHMARLNPRVAPARMH